MRDSLLRASHGSNSTHSPLLLSLQLLDLRPAGTATLSKMYCHCDDYSEVVISISPQPEPHLLQAVFFLDPETSKYGFVCNKRLPRPYAVEDRFPKGLPQSHSIGSGSRGRNSGWLLSLQNVADADGALMRHEAPSGCQARMGSKVFWHPPASVYLLFQWERDTVRTQQHR